MTTSATTSLAASVGAGQQFFAGVDQLKHSGGQNRGDRQQKRETGGRLARQSAAQAAENRGARARRAGHEGRCLCEADDDRVAQADLLHVAAFDACLAAARDRPFRDCEQHGHAGQCGAHHVQRTQRRFDVVFEHQAADDDRQRADGDHPAELRIRRGRELAAAQARRASRARMRTTSRQKYHNTATSVPI